jgi:hypothetical protein
MSGPIVRKYGFPNFEKIFGEREVQHGVEEPEARPEPDGTGLPPDLAHTPVDPNRPESAGKIAPSTEFGSTGG